MTEVKTDIDFVQMASDIAVIKQAILGVGGVHGLSEKVENLEVAQKRQGWINGFCAGIGFVFGGCITFLIDFFRS